MLTLRASSAGRTGSVQSLHESPAVALGIGDCDLLHAMITCAGRIEFDASSNQAVMNRSHIVNQHADPGSEAAGLLFPVRNRPIEPHLTVTNHQLDVANHPGLVGPAFPFDEPEDLDTPVSDGAGIGAEDVRDHSPGRRLDAHDPILPRLGAAT